MLKINMSEGNIQGILQVMSVADTKYVLISKKESLLVFYASNTEYFKLFPINIRADGDDVSYRIPIDIMQLVLGRGTLCIYDKESKLFISREIDVDGKTITMMNVAIPREIDIVSNRVAEIIKDYGTQPKEPFKDMSQIKLMYSISKLSVRGVQGPAGVAVSKGYAYIVGEGYRAYLPVETTKPMLFTNTCIAQLFKFVSSSSELNIFLSGGYNVCYNSFIMFGWKRTRNMLPLEIEEYLAIKPTAIYKLNADTIINAMSHIVETKMYKVNMVLNLDSRVGTFSMANTECKVAIFSDFVSGERAGDIQLNYSLCKSIFSVVTSYTNIELRVYDSFLALVLKSGIHLIIGRC